MRLPILLLCGLIVVTPGFQGPVSGGQSARATAPDPLAFLGAPERVAAGVELFRVDAPSADPPRSLRLLRLDPRHVRLASALATAEVPGRATVLDIARRTGALAAVNAGFFSPTGDPNGLLKIDGRLLSDTNRSRGAVALQADHAGNRSLFDQVRGRVRLRLHIAGRWRHVPVDAVDTTRGAGRLVLYTPASGPSTDTAGGLEWTLRARGRGFQLVRTAGGPVATTGNAAIPRDGYVLSYGGTRPPPALAGLARATSIQVDESIVVRSGVRTRDWARASTIVGGAGLLIRDGRALTEWTVERLSAGFETTPHPRTVIARDRADMWWLITIDGRQPGRAVGMSFREMQALLARLDVTDALNLDGGGSTTMVAGNVVVNRPSDLTGPRPVSDAIVVMAR